MKNLKVKLLWFIIGAITFGGIGYAIATTNIASSGVEYLSSKNQDVENISDALDDLYENIIGVPNVCYKGVCGKLTYRYWNDNFNLNLYDSNSMPVNNYASREQLAVEYDKTAAENAKFNDRPFYIRSSLINNNVVGHEVCLFYNQKEFCYNENFWGGEIGVENIESGNISLLLLSRRITNIFGIEPDQKSSSQKSVTVGYDSASLYCLVHYMGHVYCFNSDYDCGVYGDGSNASGSAKCGYRF